MTPDKAFSLLITGLAVVLRVWGHILISFMDIVRVYKNSVTYISTDITFAGLKMVSFWQPLTNDAHRRYTSNIKTLTFNHKFDTHSFLVVIDNQDYFVGTTKNVNIKINSIKSYLNT